VKEKGQWNLRDVIGAKTTFDFPVSKDQEIKALPATGGASEPNMDEESVGDSEDEEDLQPPVD